MKGRERKNERESTDKNEGEIGSFPKCLKQLGPVQAKTRSWDLIRISHMDAKDPRTRAVITCGIPGCAGNAKQSWDFNPGAPIWDAGAPGGRLIAAANTQPEGYISQEKVEGTSGLFIMKIRIIVFREGIGRKFE